MKRHYPTAATQLDRNTSTEGETIETKVKRLATSNEPINEVDDKLFTERKDGVNPDYNIRTDRWDAALDAMDYVARSHRAKRAERIKEREEAKKAAAATPAAGASEGGEGTA